MYICVYTELDKLSLAPRDMIQARIFYLHWSRDRRRDCLQSALNLILPSFSFNSLTDSPVIEEWMDKTGRCDRNKNKPVEDRVKIFWEVYPVVSLIAYMMRMMIIITSCL